MFKILVGMHIFVGIGAISGGLAAILDPLQPLGVPSKVLQYSPFSSFLIPGLILFGVIGLGNMIAALLHLRRSHYSKQISFLIGIALVVWITVQCLMLQTIHFLHLLFFGIGLAQMGLSLNRKERELSITQPPKRTR